MRRSAAATTFLLSVLIVANVAAARSSVSVPSADPAATDPATTDRAYAKGSIDTRLVIGRSMPVDLVYAHPDQRLSLFALEVGRIMTVPHGPAALAGQLEMLFQVMPVVASGRRDFRGTGFSPAYLRWHFSGTKHVRPLLEAGAGFMLVHWKGRQAGDIPLNFYQTFGFGMRVGHASGPGLAFGYRFQHISNGGRAEFSHGTDTHLLYAGCHS